jgi:glycosyltransferase involved in cell wall biosynthesis
MRTYGVHGGEQQLSQLFGANKRADIEEAFAFIYKDLECANLFQQRAPQLVQHTLWAYPQPTGLVLSELLKLIPRLPLLQWRYFQLVMKKRPHVCVIHGFQAAIVAWPTAFFCRKISSSYVHRITKKASKFAFFFRLLYWPFQLLAGNSKAAMLSLAPYTNPSKLLSLENGIDLEMFDRQQQGAPKRGTSSEEGYIIISVGRLLPYKGQDLLIDALALLVRKHPFLRLWIVGDGTSRQELEDQVHSLGIQSRVTFFGQRSDVPILLGQAQLFAYASSWEGMSNAVLEAMASRLPSVVADAPGVSECHVQGVTGIIVERNSQAIARGMEQLLTAPARGRLMGAAARERVEAQYTIATARERYDSLYQCLLSNR